MANHEGEGRFCAGAKSAKVAGKGGAVCEARFVQHGCGYARAGTCEGCGAKRFCIATRCRFRRGKVVRRRTALLIRMGRAKGLQSGGEMVSHGCRTESRGSPIRTGRLLRVWPWSGDGSCRSRDLVSQSWGTESRRRAIDRKRVV